MKIANYDNHINIANGLMTSIMISTCCIVLVIALGYISLHSYNDKQESKQGNRNTQKQSPTSNTGNTPQGGVGNNGDSTSLNQGINTITKPIDGTNDIQTLLQNIESSSKSQLGTWQERNIDPTFMPQTIMPRYFKTFNGDNYSMQK